MKLCFFLVYVLMHFPLRDVHFLSDPIHFSRTQYFSKSSNNSSRGANLTPYSGVIFWGVILTPNRSLKNSFSGVKVTPDIEELK